MGTAILPILILGILLINWLLRTWEIIKSPKATIDKKILWIIGIILSIALPIYATLELGKAANAGGVTLNSFTYMSALILLALAIGPAVIKKLFDKFNK